MRRPAVLGAIGLACALLWPGGVGAQEPAHGFVDVYGAITELLESDVPDWSFKDRTSAVGVRVGVWIGDNWGLTFRSWYFQTDAKQDVASPSDLAVLGLSLEVMARWRLDDRWALYASLGPALAVTTLDLQLVSGANGTDQDARSLAPGVSGGAGLEVRLFSRVSAFAEGQTSLFYPSFEFRDRTITPRLLNLYGLVGFRLSF